METYKYYFGEVSAVEYKEKHDPLNKYSENSNSSDWGPSENYYVLPEENVRWIAENIFNVSDWVNSYEVNEADYSCYLYNDKFYVQEIGFDGGDYTWYSMDSISSNGDGTISLYCTDKNSGGDSYRLDVALKNIDGERRWTVVSLQK